MRSAFPSVETTTEGQSVRLETLSGRVHLELTDRQFAVEDLTMEIAPRDRVVVDDSDVA